MKHQGTLLLKRSDVAALLTMNECIDAVENAFRAHASQEASPPGILGIHTREGAFHIKAGILELDRPYFAAKSNANFPGNPARFGLPLIQGVVLLCDAETGYPLAIMDSMELTILRTGAATAVAAKHLALPAARTATIFGCGNQGRISVLALLQVRPISRVFAFDVDPQHAIDFARDLSREARIEVTAVDDPGPAVLQREVCVTCTPSTRFILRREWVGSGTFVAAVGADSDLKQEIDPALMATSNVVVDLTDQCATIGDLHHAIAAGLMTAADVHAQLGEV